MKTRSLLLSVLTVLMFTSSRATAGQGYERRDVGFVSKGLRCVGWYYVPTDIKPGEKRPAIVMAHGWTGVKEMYLGNFAERFAEAGFVVLVFDYRYQGASEGEPRGQVIWYDQTEDYQNGITWVSLQKEVDPTRIGVWGSSYSGAHVLHLGAYDKRIKAVVSQVPAINGWARLLRFVAPDQLQGFFDWLAADRTERLTKGTVSYVPSVAPPGQPSSLPGKESYDWFTEASKRAPNWINKVTVESIEKAIQYHPTANIQAISPTPLMMIVASHDTITPTDQSIEAFQRALEPKSLIIVKGGHFEAYQGPKHDQFVRPAVDWFKRWLMSQ